jgi:BlaI family penicillinase repressor
MQKHPDISPTEWEIMEIIWAANGEVSSAETIAALAAKKHWKSTTIKTLLARLVQKKALAFRADGNRYLYRPLVSRADCVQAEGASFMQRMFGGAAAAMLLHFAPQAGLSRKDVAELKEMLRRSKS